MFAVLLSLSMGLQAQMGGKIKGTVTNQDKVPIEFATLHVQQSGVIKAGAYTDEDGVFTIGPLPAGDYLVVAKFAGDVSPAKTLTVEQGEATSVEFVLDQSNPMPVRLIKEEQAPKNRPLSKKSDSTGKDF